MDDLASTEKIPLGPSCHCPDHCPNRSTLWTSNRYQPLNIWRCWDTSERQMPTICYAVPCVTLKIANNRRGRVLTKIHGRTTWMAPLPCSQFDIAKYFKICPSRQKWCPEMDENWGPFKKLSLILIHVLMNTHCFAESFILISFVLMAPEGPEETE